MDAEHRRHEIIEALQKSSEPIVARSLADEFDVSRQVIVGDIALLRASGMDIYSTPKGYLMRQTGAGGLTIPLVCLHTFEETREELYTIVDCGCEVLDVIVEHPLYGMMKGELNIASRLDADDFIAKLNETETSLLSTLTDGVHTHTIRCRDEATRDRCIHELKNKGLLYE